METGVNRMGVDRQGGRSGDGAFPRFNADALALHKSNDSLPTVPSCTAGDGNHSSITAMKEDNNNNKNDITYEEQVSEDMFGGVSPIGSLNASTNKEDSVKGNVNITHPKIRCVEMLEKPIKILRSRSIHASDTASEVISISDSSDSEPRRM